MWVDDFQQFKIELADSWISNKHKMVPVVNITGIPQAPSGITVEMKNYYLITNYSIQSNLQMRVGVSHATIRLPDMISLIMSLLH